MLFIRVALLKVGWCIREAGTCWVCILPERILIAKKFYCDVLLNVARYDEVVAGRVQYLIWDYMQ